MESPYEHQSNFNKLFTLTLNKLYAWNLINYEHISMLDANNLFLKKTNELSQCGLFCVVFISPFIFHIGLFILQVFENFPSSLTFDTYFIMMFCAQKLGFPYSHDRRYSMICWINFPMVKKKKMVQTKAF